MKILIVVDMQNDFISGSLGTKEAVEILPKVQDKIEKFMGKLIFTRDTHDNHYLDTMEGRHLPVLHCIKGTWGWEINARLSEFISTTIIDKSTFGSKDLPNIVKSILKDNSLKEEDLEITLIGLCTDICVISNAMIVKGFYPEAIIKVDASCCAGVTPATHQNALEAMKMCHIIIENEE